MPRRDWTREELIVAFNLYCKIPFGRIHIRNPLVIELAKAIGRTPSAVSWKLANFARLDPSLQKRNIAGAAHGAQSEVEIWNEFSNDWDKLAFESERLLGQMTGSEPKLIVEERDFPQGISREALVRVRVNQGFFRSAVLAAYGTRCCITGLSIPQLLTASHIVPWSVDIKNRTNPQNGLCLNAIHDRAFDNGLITVTPELKIKVSTKMKRNVADKAAREFIWDYEGARISPPRRFAPNADFLRYHNDNIFLRR
jgi:putative restriction endonuclease